MTLSDKIFQTLAKDILSGTVTPGQRLDEPSICRQFGVSRTPVREALRRLSGTGLVEITPRKGVSVVRIDVEQLTDMFEALAEFEALCARLGAVRMTALEKKRLEILNANHHAKVAAGATWSATLNNEFHESIYQGSHSPSIAGVTRSFRQRLMPFQALQFVPGQTEATFHEHDEILEAIIASDAARAYGLMRDHLTSSGLRVIEHFSPPQGEASARASVSER